MVSHANFETYHQAKLATFEYIEYTRCASGITVAGNIRRLMTKPLFSANLIFHRLNGGLKNPPVYYCNFNRFGAVALPQAIDTSEEMVRTIKVDLD